MVKHKHHLGGHALRHWGAERLTAGSLGDAAGPDGLLGHADLSTARQAYFRQRTPGS